MVGGRGVLGFSIAAFGAVCWIAAGLFYGLSMSSLAGAALVAASFTVATIGARGPDARVLAVG
ncbi:MAG: hypothetical protein ACT4PT_11890, partial [Methanobacteriota archaeon]